MKCFWAELREQGWRAEGLFKACGRLHGRPPGAPRGSFWGRKHATVDGEFTCFYTRKHKAWKRARWREAAKAREQEVCPRCDRPIPDTEGTKDWGDGEE